MLGSPDISNLADAERDALTTWIIDRARAVDSSEVNVAEEIADRINRWRTRAPSQYWNDLAVRSSLLQSAERAATMRALGRSEGEAWPTLNNMRNVEPAVPVKLVPALRIQGQGNGDSNGQ
jgi:hypothetical protein